VGQRGPVPNRSEDLSRERDANRGDRPEITKGTLLPVTIPEPDPEWHDIAKMLWESLALSGQAAYYQQSDWAFAYSLCDDLSYYKNPLVDRNGIEYHKRSGQMLQTIYSAMERLLVTEGDRRRVRIELSEPEPEEDEAAVLMLADYQAALGLTEEPADES
jgi:hypothetical protein